MKSFLDLEGLKRFKESLASVATSGSYNDLDDKPTIDDTLSDTSTNPVQNKVVKSALDEKAPSNHNHTGTYIENGGRVANVGFNAEKELFATIDGVPYSVPFGYTRADMANFAIKGELPNVKTGVVEEVFGGSLNFDDYKTPGFYRFNGNTSYTNMPPVPSYGQVIISRNEDTTLQIACGWNGSNLAFRCFNDSTSNAPWNSGDYLPTSGGTMTGNIITPANDDMGIMPATNNYGQIGSSDKKYYRMYATTFNGDLNGNATSATKATNDGLGHNIANTYRKHSPIYVMSGYKDSDDTSISMTSLSQLIQPTYYPYYPYSSGAPVLYRLIVLMLNGNDNGDPSMEDYKYDNFSIRQDVTILSYKEYDTNITSIGFLSNTSDNLVGLSIYNNDQIQINIKDWAVFNKWVAYLFEL